MSNDNFWNLFPLFTESPPVIIDPADGVLRRHRGGSTRCSFWAGYDGIKVGPNVGTRGSVAHSAYRAGVHVRRRVDAGTIDPLPSANA